MFRKLLRCKKHKGSEPIRGVCPAFAIGCDNCTPISVLKPEIVIEERRWVPYPMVIRHYIPRQKRKKDNCFKQVYCYCVEELREWEARRKDKKRAKDAAERIERERCLKELRRLHSYHQKLIYDTQSFTAFSKHVRNPMKPKGRLTFLPKQSSASNKSVKQKKKKGEDNVKFTKLSEKQKHKKLDEKIKTKKPEKKPKYKKLQEKQKIKISEEKHKNKKPEEKHKSKKKEKKQKVRKTSEEVVITRKSEKKKRKRKRSQRRRKHKRKPEQFQCLKNVGNVGCTVAMLLIIGGFFFFFV